MTSAPSPSRYDVALIRRFRAAILAGAEAEAEAVSRIAMRLGMTRSEISHHIIAPALHEVGMLWETAVISVFEEHVATAVATAVMGRLPVTSGATEEIGLSAVAASPAPEGHALGARMVTDTLRDDGWNVLYVGAGVPQSDLVAFAKLHRPHLVCLSVSLSGHLPAVQEVTLSLRGLPHPPVVIVGGWGCRSAAAERLAADAVSCDLLGLPDLARNLCLAHAG